MDEAEKMTDETEKLIKKANKILDRAESLYDRFTIMVKPFWHTIIDDKLIKRHWIDTALFYICILILSAKVVDLLKLELEIALVLAAVIIPLIFYIGLAILRWKWSKSLEEKGNAILKELQKQYWENRNQAVEKKYRNKGFVCLKSGENPENRDIADEVWGMSDENFRFSLDRKYMTFEYRTYREFGTVFVGLDEGAYKVKYSEHDIPGKPMKVGIDMFDRLYYVKATDETKARAFLGSTNMNKLMDDPDYVYGLADESFTVEGEWIKFRMKLIDCLSHDGWFRYSTPKEFKDNYFIYTVNLDKRVSDAAGWVDHFSYLCRE